MEKSNDFLVLFYAHFDSLSKDALAVYEKFAGTARNKTEVVFARLDI